MEIINLISVSFTVICITSVVTYGIIRFIRKRYNIFLSSLIDKIADKAVKESWVYTDKRMRVAKEDWNDLMNKRIGKQDKNITKLAHAVFDKVEGLKRDIEELKQEIE